MSQKPDGRASQKTREEIKAEREAKKLAKAAAKAGKAKAKVAVAACGTAAATANNCKIPEKDASTKENHRANIETDKGKSIECANATTSNISEKSEKNAINKNKSHVEESRVAVEEPKEVEEAKESKEIKEAKEAKDQRLNGSVENGASEGGDNEEKQGMSKAELRAERRAKQEAQRAAKLQKDNAAKEPVKPCVDTAVSSQCPAKKSVTKSATNENAHELNLFKHLYDERELSSFNVAVNSRIHPAIIRLGVQYANRVVVGSNARCVALLAAIKQVVRDFVKPAQADFVRGLEVSLQESLAYLHHCRPLAVSMKNAMRHLKCQMVRFSSSWLDEEVNQLFLLFINYFLLRILIMFFFNISHLFLGQKQTARYHRHIHFGAGPTSWRSDILNNKKQNIEWKRYFNIWLVSIYRVCVCGFTYINIFKLKHVMLAAHP